MHNFVLAALQKQELLTFWPSYARIATFNYTVPPTPDV
jgi:hypothetical protein